MYLKLLWIHMEGGNIMVSSVSGSSYSSYAMQFTRNLASKIVSADTDGAEGLSQAELSSLASSTDGVGSNFLSALSANFDKIDTDGNGEITTEEMGSMVNSWKQSSSSSDGVEDALV